MSSPCSLFVGDLALFTTEMDIVDLFTKCGFRLLEVKIIRDKSHSLNYGFVTLDSPEAALTALMQMDQTYLCGRRLKVRRSGHKIKTEKADNAINSIHVRFRALKSNVLVTEESLHHLFAYFGPISDVVIKFSSRQPDTPAGVQTGYGFVHFDPSSRGFEAALAAVASFSSLSIVNHVKYACEMSKSLKQVLHGGSQSMEPLQAHPQPFCEPIHYSQYPQRHSSAMMEPRFVPADQPMRDNQLHLQPQLRRQQSPPHQHVFREVTDSMANARGYADPLWLPSSLKMAPSSSDDEFYGSLTPRVDFSGKNMPRVSAQRSEPFADKQRIHLMNHEHSTGGTNYFRGHRTVPIMDYWTSGL